MRMRIATVGARRRMARLWSRRGAWRRVSRDSLANRQPDVGAGDPRQTPPRSQRRRRASSRRAACLLRPGGRRRSPAGGAACG